MLSGKASASDIAAGVALGQAIAPIFSRARAPTAWAPPAARPRLQALSDAARARGDMPWNSMEFRPRPPMLPLFGKVNAWMMTPDDIVKERPGRRRCVVAADGAGARRGE